MSAPYYEDATVALHHGDCLDVLRSLPDASVDAVVTDPPYGLGFMGREWDSLPPGVPFAAECLRVLKPGGHMLAFGGSRTWHRLACAVEDAGFEVRDSIAWMYGSGFPKSLDVSKAIDKAARGVPQGGVDPTSPNHGQYRTTTTEGRRWDSDKGQGYGAGGSRFLTSTASGRTGASNTDPAQTTTPSAAAADGSQPPTLDATAAEWQGWGTALKPAFEPIVVARKPLAGTVAQNVLTYGTGALNIDACRINASGQSPEPPTSQGDGRSSRGDNTTCTCPGLADDRTSRTLSTPPLASSDASLAGRSDLPASAPRGENDRPRPLDSPVGYQSSPRSGDAPAREAAEDGQASPQPRPDADTSPARCATCGHNRSTQSMPYGQSTTPHVQREATRTGEASADRRYTERGGTNFAPLPGVRGGDPAGRWPANVVLDESQAEALDEQSGELTSGALRPYTEQHDNASSFQMQRDKTYASDANTGGASRFFYVAKADSSERVRLNGTAHPTVKPLALMRWLVRLVTPPGGTVLEPFAGSGTTVEACILEGFRCVAIEREADYLPLIVQRINRRRDPVAAVKATGGDGGLFDLLDGASA